MLFTIGTSDHSLPSFLDELARRNIRHIVDVRSQPFSRLAHFSAPQVQRWSDLAGIYYRQAGEVLGGRSAANVKGRRYIAEIDRLVTSSTREPLAIFCAEGDPRKCHRTYEVAATILVEFGLVATSILRSGNDEEVTKTLSLTKPELIPKAIRDEALRLSQEQPTDTLPLPF
jgi:uncharacterized protein (DUF488 family)